MTGIFTYTFTINESTIHVGKRTVRCMDTMGFLCCPVVSGTCGVVTFRLSRFVGSMPLHDGPVGEKKGPLTGCLGY